MVPQLQKHVQCFSDTKIAGIVKCEEEINRSKVDTDRLMEWIDCVKNQGSLIETHSDPVVTHAFEHKKMLCG